MQPPQKIEDIGLEQYLNQTANDHHGNTYADFVRMANDGVTPINLGRVFGVSRSTVNRWLKLLEAEDGR